MTYCSACRFADDNGVLGNVTVCSFDGEQRWMSDACERWEEETRDFREMYPEYPRASPDSTGRHLAMLRKHAIEAGETLEEVQPGLVRIVGREGAQLMLEEL